MNRIGRSGESRRLGQVFAIAVVDLRRFFGSRSNLFFAFVAPFLMILLIGSAFGDGGGQRIGVVDLDDSRLSGRLVSALEATGAAEDGAEAITADRRESHSDLRAAVQSGEVQAGLVIPAGYGAKVTAGETVELTYLTQEADLGSADAGSVVRSVVAKESSLLGAADFGVSEGTGPLLENLRVADGLVDTVPGVRVEVTTAGDRFFPVGFNAFAFSAPPMMLMFVFLMTLGASLIILQARQLGLARRMYAAPVTAGTIVAGQAVGKLVVALTQGGLIMLGAGLLFGVTWGDPVGAMLVLLLFGLVAAGAAVVLGSLSRSEGQATALVSLIGLGLAATGGTMFPLDLFGDTMRTVAHITPHAWGYEAFAALVRDNAGLTDILPQLGALAGFAVVLWTVGVLAMRRTLVAP